MKEQQVRSDHKREQMDFNHENILLKQEKLRLLNQQLLTQVATLQNNPVQMEGDPENIMSPYLRTLDELIQKRIKEARLLDHPTPTIKIHGSPLSKEI